MVNKIDNNVIIGGDSAASAGSLINIRKDPKVFKNGEFIIGCTTSFRMMQLLRYSFNPPNINDKELFEYMVTDFVEEVRECFKRGGFEQKFTDGDEKGGQFLVGYKDRLFLIDNDYQVGENIDGIDALGCGQQYAFGALHVLKNVNISVNKKIKMALDASSYYSTGVEPPYIILNT
jgi:ATP-dependent protease HslVU (ClpYQ) peptidase subunit